MLKTIVYLYIGMVTLWAILGVIAYIMLQITRRMRRDNPLDYPPDNPAE